MTKKFFTCQELEAIELRKSNELVGFRRSIVSLREKRSGLLVDNAVSESKSVLAEIAVCEAELKSLELRADSIDALLADIPRQKAYADSIQAEKEAIAIDQVIAELPQLLEKIDEAAEALVLAVKAARGELFSLGSKANVKNFGRSVVQGIAQYSLNEIEAVAFFSQKHGVHIDYGQGGYSPKTAKESNAGQEPGAGAIRKLLEERASWIRKKRAWLRGEVASLEFCPNCYGSWPSWDSQKGRRICSCGSELTPFLKPYETSGD